MHNLCHTTVYTLQYESTNKSLLNSYGQRSVVLCCGYGMNRTSRKPSEKYTNKSISVVWCVETECGVSARLAHAHIRMHQRIQLCSHKSRRSIFLVFSFVVFIFDFHCVRLSPILSFAACCESAFVNCIAFMCVLFVTYIAILSRWCL